MFREMRKKERELNREETIGILNNNEYGILSTISQNGYPYGVPVSYVFYKNAIYFHCAVEGHKKDNILNSSKVSFCVVGETCILPEKFSTKYESAIVFGTASEVSGDEKEAALLEIIKKYSPDFMEKGKEYIKNASKVTTVMRIDIEHMTGKTRR